MTNNLKTLIQTYARYENDSSYFNKCYDYRLDCVYMILIKDFKNIIKSSTHKDHANRLYREFADAFKLKFVDVRTVGNCARRFNQEELVGVSND